MMRLDSKNLIKAKHTKEGESICRMEHYSLPVTPPVCQVVVVKANNKALIILRYREPYTRLIEAFNNVFRNCFDT